MKVPCEIAMMRVRKRCSNRLAISAIPLPETSPPAHPSSPRPTIRAPMFGAIAQPIVTEREDLATSV
jgi:hypothetical protein